MRIILRTLSLFRFSMNSLGPEKGEREKCWKWLRKKSIFPYMLWAALAIWLFTIFFPTGIVSYSLFTLECIYLMMTTAIWKIAQWLVYHSLFNYLWNLLATNMNKEAPPPCKVKQRSTALSSYRLGPES